MSNEVKNTEVMKSKRFVLRQSLVGKNELIEVLGLALDITNHEKGKAALLKATKLS